MKTQKATSGEIAKMWNLINDHLHPIGDLWFYDEGWNDARVAKEATKDPAAPLGVQHAQGVRQREFGKLRSVAGAVDLTEQVAKLEARVAEIERRINTLGIMGDKT